MDPATSFDLGSAHEPDELDIQDFVLSFLYHQYYYPTPHPPDSITVMMTGSPESLSDGKARRVMKRVIEALGAKADVLEENPSFIASRGAAELAWRALKLNERSKSRGSTSLKGPPGAFLASQLSSDLGRTRILQRGSGGNGMVYVRIGRKSRILRSLWNLKW